MAYIKNIEQDTVLSLAGQVEAQPGQISSAVPWPRTGPSA